MFLCYNYVFLQFYRVILISLFIPKRYMKEESRRPSTATYDYLQSPYMSPSPSYSHQPHSSAHLGPPTHSSSPTHMGGVSHSSSAHLSPASHSSTTHLAVSSHGSSSHLQKLEVPSGPIWTPSAIEYSQVPPVIQRFIFLLKSDIDNINLILFA